MPNAYVSVDTLKSPGVLNIGGTSDDARLRTLAESVSRVIDRYCNRHFYVLSAARRFDGDGGIRLLVPDLVSIDDGGLRTDDGRDRTFATAWTEADYVLLPSNADPANAGNSGSRPYTAIEVDVDAGTKAAFRTGREAVQIAGQWGWWRHLKRASETVNAGVDASAAGVTLSRRTGVEAGHTLLVGSEQMFVEGCSGDTLAVARAVNGTTGEPHGPGAPVDLFLYPGPVVEAAIIQVARLWRRADGAVCGGLDPDVRLMLGQYRKLPVGV